MLIQLLKNYTNQFADVITFNNKQLYLFDFSKNNKELTDAVIKDTESLSDYINKKLNANHAQIGYGGYLENRVIYKRSEHFGGDTATSRTIHLGLDLWCDAGEPVFSPYDAKIHSFQNNNNFLDYGATIILEHQIEEIRFYTLYGHLSYDSLKDIEVGQLVKKGQKIAELGKPSENGDWPPHLHFQIISDMEGHRGDFPGVCSPTEQEKFAALCPNPNLIVNIC